MSNKAFKYLITALVVTFLFRGGFALNSLFFPQRAFATWPDTWEYEAVAYSLYTGNGYSMHPAPPYKPEMIVTPIYPFVIAGVYRAFGRHVCPLLTLNILFALISVALIFVTALKLTGNEKAAAVASLIFGLNPNAALYSSQVLAETMYLTLSITAFFIAVMDNDELHRALLFGIIGGLLILTKPIGILPFLSALLYALWRHKKATWLWSLLLSMVVVFPWVYRNHREFGRWKLSSVSDMTLTIYHAAPIVSYEKKIPLDSAAVAYLGRELYEKVANRYPDPAALDSARKLAVKVISRHPWIYMRLMLTGVPVAVFMPMSLAEFARFIGADVGHQPVAQEVISALSKIKIAKALETAYQKRFKSLKPNGILIYFYAVVFNLLYLFLTVIGFLRFPEKRFAIVIFIMSLIFLIPVGICPSPRYRLQLAPFWSILAGFGAVSFKKIKGGEKWDS